MLTVQDVARLTGFSRAAISARCQAGKLKASQDEDGRWIIDDEEVTKLQERLLEPHYSPAEAAALLSFSPPVITAFLREGQQRGMGECPFPNAIKVFNQWRIPESDLARLIQSGRAELAVEPSAQQLLKEARYAKRPPTLLFAGE
jgi:predicted site-specific integrase-resolvase